MNRNPMNPIKLTVRAEHLLATIIAKIEALPTLSDPDIQKNQKFWDFASEVTDQEEAKARVPENASKAYAELCHDIVEEVTPDMTLGAAYPIAKRILSQPPEEQPAPPPAPSPERTIKVFGRLMKAHGLHLGFDEEMQRYEVRQNARCPLVAYGATMLEAMANTIEGTRKNIADARKQNDDLEKLLDD